jgi:hypothetical protein
VDYLKFLSYISLGIGEHELSHLFRRKDDFLENLVRIIGVEDMIGATCASSKTPLFRYRR